MPIIPIKGASIAELMIEKNLGVEEESSPIRTHALYVIVSGDDTPDGGTARDNRVGQP